MNATLDDYLDRGQECIEAADHLVELASVESRRDMADGLLYPVLTMYCHAIEFAFIRYLSCYDEIIGKPKPLRRLDLTSLWVGFCGSLESLPDEPIVDRDDLDYLSTFVPNFQSKVYLATQSESHRAGSGAAKHVNLESERSAAHRCYGILWDLGNELESYVYIQAACVAWSESELERVDQSPDSVLLSEGGRFLQNPRYRSSEPD